MSVITQELSGIVTLDMAVKVADGILAKDQRVKISADNEVEKVDSAQDHVFGYVLTPNDVAGGNAGIVTRGKRVSDETTGGTYSAGEFVSVDASNKIVRSTPANASGTITISDYSAIDSGDTVTVNGVVLTAGGTDWTAATSNTATALSLATAINNKVAGVKASVAPAAAIVVVEALVLGAAGNSIALETSMTVTVEGTVSGAALTGGRDQFPMGQALEASSGADQTKSVLWF